LWRFVTAILSSSEIIGQALRQLVEFPQLTFPNNDDIPSTPPEFPLVSSISVYSPFEFRQPVILTRGWRGGPWTSWMAVPETAMNKYHGGIPRKNYVGFTGQIFSM
jgi:hypothetical protein